MHKPSAGALIMGLMPFIGMCFSVSFWDRLYPFVFGLPFNLFWLTCWIVLTPLFMFGAYTIEKRHQGGGLS